MADDNTLRSRSYRSNDPYRRSASPADAPDTALGGSSDPLAELARLIGQPDPFHETVRREPQASPQHADDAGDWRRHVQPPNYDEPAYDLDARYASDADSRYAPADPHRDSYRMTAQDRITEQEPDRYADPHAGYRHDPSYAAADYPEEHYPEEQMYADAQHRAGYAEDQHHAGMRSPGDDDYDDPPRRKRSGSSSLVTAVVLIGCAMLGTAGAYGYRTYSGSSGSGQAPVIIADSAPNKIVPNSEQKSARSQDRVGGQGDERLVSREEQPMALPGSSAVPRVVFPSAQPGPATTGTTPSASNAQSSSADQPKRIRTVPIRPDGGDASGRPADEAPSRAAPPPPTRASRDVPLSLDPATPAPVNEAARAQQRAVTPPAPRETAAPAPRVAAVPPQSNASGSGYLVQVSSQRSESDAQSSYRGLQAKYSQLKSKQAIIRRADLGSKGVYYRAMVGPFESSDEAGQFCNGLKQAGGQCIILRN